MSAIAPTLEQLKVAESVFFEPIIKINAFAGTGKTSTLLLITNKYPEKRFLYLAYNKGIETEAKKKFPRNVEVKTIHALAYFYVAKYTRLNLKTVKNIKVKELSNILFINYELALRINSVFSSYCNSKSKSTESLLPEDKILIDKLISKIENQEIPPTFDYILKKFHLLLSENHVSIDVDAVLLDEFQDTNGVTIGIFENIKCSCRIVVGDAHQQIYTFRGSAGAMGKIGGTPFYLSESFRFPASITYMANSILSKYKGERISIKSKVPEYGKTFNEAFLDNNTVGYISRTNSSLVNKIMSLIDKQLEFKTIRDPEEVFRTIVDVGYIVCGEKDMISAQNAYLKSFKDAQDLENYIKEADDMELRTALKIFLEYDMDKIANAKNIANFYYKQTSMVKIHLTTAHSAKGLEWDVVIVEDDFRELVDLVADYFVESYKGGKINGYLQTFRKEIARVPQNIIDEINLFYVAVTRGKKHVKINGSNLKYIYAEESELDGFIKKAVSAAKK